MKISHNVLFRTASRSWTARIYGAVLDYDLESYIGKQIRETHFDQYENCTGVSYNTDPFGNLWDTGNVKSFGVSE